VHPVAARYDILRARAAGLDARRIEGLTGVPARSQRRIGQEEIRYGMTDQQFRQQQGVGRPSVLSERLRRQVDAMLAVDPGMKVAEILRRLRSEHGYRRGKSAVYDYVGVSRPEPKVPAPVVRFEGVAGEFAQHDFGTLAVTYIDGTREKLTFFAARLKFSRALHVTLIESENTEAVIRGMEEAATVWGGLPLINVVDNTKAAVIEHRRDKRTGEQRLRLNEQFATFIREAGVFAEPTAPYAPNQKGSVENPIRFLKEGFLLARRFRNRDDLLRQMAEWLQFANYERPCDATGEIPAARLEQERPRLKPLRFGGEGYGLVSTAVVGCDARVRKQGYQYSTPQAWIGQKVVVRIHRSQVVLLYHQEQVIHPRIPANGRYSLLPEHRTALFVKPRGEVMAKRQILMDLGPEGEAFFTELVHRRPQSWRERDLPILWELFEQFGERRMREAFLYCLQREVIGGEYARAFALGYAAPLIEVAA
jgi:transposase